MLPAPHRLRRKQDFDRVYRARRSRGDGVFVVYVLPNRVGDARFGLVVSKKYGHAPARHRAQRQVREVLRHNLKQIRQGHDVVIQIKRDLSEFSFWTIEQRLLTLLRRFGLLTQGGDVRPMARHILKTPAVADSRPD